METVENGVIGGTETGESGDIGGSGDRGKWRHRGKWRQGKVVT